MAVTQISDVVVPAEFTAYQIEKSMVSTALYQSGVLVKNGAIADALAVGSNNFSVPFWRDDVAGNAEALISNDDPTVLSTPQKITSGRQIVRKSFLNQSWSEMSLAAELAGDDPIVALQDRVSAYWDRQWENVSSLHCLACWRRTSPTTQATWWLISAEALALLLTSPLRPSSTRLRRLAMRSTA
jgi:hypothetical protein